MTTTLSPGAPSVLAHGDRTDESPSTVAQPGTNLEAAFRSLCERHDLTYSYSDDIRAWRRGRESLAQITEAAKSLPPGVAERIWNAIVDTKIVEPLRHEFYWEIPA